MATTRRSFLKVAATLSGAAGAAGFFPESIRRAFAIEPASGSTYMDAEHVVILMQENRSFDHALGTLRGVRGFNDPRTFRLPNGNLAWLQTNKAGDTYAPFRFDIKDTRITWMSSLPHVRDSQIDAWNGGHHDQWLEAKRPHKQDYAEMPLTMGYYTREDIPFYYALADAFTVCDQHFCSALTSTLPNRAIFWTGTVREQQNAASPAHIRGDYSDGAQHWRTFPELLQKAGISWKVYQNELSIDSGMTPEEKAWLANYDDNSLEYFSQYRANLSAHYLKNLPATIEKLTAEIETLEASLKDPASNPEAAKKIKLELKRAEKSLAARKLDMEQGKNGFAALSQSEKDLHQRAFTTNAGDPDYLKLDTLSYRDGSTERQLAVAKGDPFYQFRKDVQEAKLPAVSWLVASENFSDHPSAPWYGAWYVSEAMDILTQDPEVWKKTIFILTYDENDGYFDHIPPFTYPDPRNKLAGRTSSAIGADVEYIYAEDELREGISEAEARTGPIGMGFRVPMIVASPWSRGGWVNSQVFDHTSVNQFLEDFLNRKFNRSIHDDNINPWRRSIAGNLNSIFRPFDGEKLPSLPFLEKDPFLESIHKAKFKDPPSDFRKLTAPEIAAINQDPSASPLLPHQEKGIRPSSPLPCEFYVEGALDHAGNTFQVRMKAGNEVFGKLASGAPFNVSLRGVKPSADDAKLTGSNTSHVRCASYAVAAGDSLQESWPLDAFIDQAYHVDVHGPNGFFREFAGDKRDPGLTISCDYETIPHTPKALTGNLALHFTNANSKASYTVQIVDKAYGMKTIRKEIHPSDPDSKTLVLLNLEKSFGWYDICIKVEGCDRFEKRYAGRVETGRSSFSDPAMGAIL